MRGSGRRAFVAFFAEITRSIFLICPEYRIQALFHHRNEFQQSPESNIPVTPPRYIFAKTLYYIELSNVIDWNGNTESK
jgi:hypothetical protein